MPLEFFQVLAIVLQDTHSSSRHTSDIFSPKTNGKTVPSPSQISIYLISLLHLALLRLGIPPYVGWIHRMNEQTNEWVAYLAIFHPTGSSIQFRCFFKHFVCLSWYGFGKATFEKKSWMEQQTHLNDEWKSLQKELMFWRSLSKWSGVITGSGCGFIDTWPSWFLDSLLIFLLHASWESKKASSPQNGLELKSGSLIGDSQKPFFVV